MDKLILKDGTIFQIKEGASIDSIETNVSSLTDFVNLADKFTEDNLQIIEFSFGEMMTSNFTNMTLLNDTYTVQQLPTGSYRIKFGFREKTKDDALLKAITYLTDEQALNVQALYPEWISSGIYKTGDRYIYKDVLYKCLQDHEGQEDWTPDKAPSLWAKILNPDSDTVPEWEQPDSTNGYATGDKVTHNDYTWISKVDDNVWEPGVIGTESMWEKVL